MRRRIAGIVTGHLPFLSKAVAASLIATVVDFALLAFLTEIVGLHYQLSASIGFYAGTNVTYFLSITWIFPHRSVKSKLVEYILFFAVGTVGVGFNALLLWFFTEILGIYYMFSKVISGSLVFFWNFYARKHILFRDPAARVGEK